MSAYNFISKLRNNRGELATVVALIGLGIVTVGIIAGRQLIQTGPRDIPQAQTTDRPNVCVSSTISNKIVTSSNPTTITLNGTPPAGYWISKFRLAFYNLDNLYGPGNPKPIMVNGVALVKDVAVTGSTTTSKAISVAYSEVHKLDSNWGNKYPVNIQVNGYFFLNDGRFSAADPDCVESFSLATATPTSAPNCIDTDGGKNYTKYGETYISGSNSKLVDSCSLQNGVSTLQEGYCTTSGTVASEAHTCTSGCSNGACLGVTPSKTPTKTPTKVPTKTPTPGTASCIDTDGGKNYTTYGETYISGTNTKYVDSCSVQNGIYTLHEGYCSTSTSVANVSYTCPSGCSNGACIGITTTITPTKTPTKSPTKSPTPIKSLTPVPTGIWKTPGGLTCSTSNAQADYFTHYPGTNCSASGGFLGYSIAESVLANCSTTGSGKCFRVSGTASNIQSGSRALGSTKTCTTTSSGYTTTAYPNLTQCFWNGVVIKCTTDSQCPIRQYCAADGLCYQVGVPTPTGGTRVTPTPTSVIKATPTPTKVTTLSPTKTPTKSPTKSPTPIKSVTPTNVVSPYTIAFSPSQGTLPPNSAFKIMVNAGNNSVAFGRVVFNFNPSKVNLASEITTNPNLSTVVEKTTASSANSTGRAVVVVAASPSDTQPAGSFEFATVTFKSVSGTANDTAQVTIDSSDLQIVTGAGNALTMAVTPLNLTLNSSGVTVTGEPSITPINCPAGPRGNLDCSLDACIDTADFELFRQAYGMVSGEVVVPDGQYSPDLIQDQSNMIDTADYEILRSNFGSCFP